MDTSVKAFQIWVHKGFYLLVVGVHPSRLPVSQTAPPTRGIVGYRPARHAYCFQGQLACWSQCPPPMVARLSNIGVITTLLCPLPSKGLSSAFLVPHTISAAPFIGEACPLNWHRVPDVIQNVD